MVNTQTACALLHCTGMPQQTGPATQRPLRRICRRGGRRRRRRTTLMSQTAMMRMWRALCAPATTASQTLDSRAILR